jgi:predicted nuclease of restriction endonuclease-like (RecB) superfamily
VGYSDPHPPAPSTERSLNGESAIYAGKRSDCGFTAYTKPMKRKAKMITSPNLDLASREEPVFSQIVQLIQSSRQQALETVNTVLIDLYWKVGGIISSKLESAEWGDGVVNQLASFIAQTQPGQRGFSRPNLFRMKQFYEAYRNEPKVSALLRQLPWTHHTIILSQSKRPEEREFYLRMAAHERWSSRQLERQFKAALFERVILNPPKVSALTRQIHPEALSVFRDAYTVEFLSLPTLHAEADLHRALLEKLKDFLLEMGRDFCFVGSEYPVQVGGRDFALDLLFFHRGLNCLVAMELKVDRFEPEYLGKLSFYLEALDRDVRKPHEQPSIGVLLCASKDDEVVEYALSRTLSPALIAEYQTQLPDKKILQAKLHEFYLQNSPDGEDAPKER